MNERFAKIDDRFAKMDERFTGMDERFAGMDERFTSIDGQLADLKAQLGVRIEAVDHKVGLAYEAIVAVRKKVDTMAADTNIASRLENHEIRILALESRKPATE